MRIAYVHGYEGVTGPLLLGAFLDAGASLSRWEQARRQLHLPTAELSCACALYRCNGNARDVDWLRMRTHSYTHTPMRLS